MANPNVMLLLVSRFISQLGDKFFLPAVLWLAISGEGGSTTRLGVISILMAIPPLSSVFIGVFIDKVDKKKLMVTCDWIRFVLCGMLVLNQLWYGEFWVLAFLIFWIEFAGQFFTIASGSIIPSIVKEDELIKTNSYFSASDNITSLLGYSLGGVLIAIVGMNVLIGVNAASFLLSGILLLFMRLTRSEQVETDKGEDDKKGKVRNYMQDLGVGLRLVFRNKIIANLLLTFMVLNIATASLEMLITIWAHDVLQLGSTGYGILLTSILVGSLVGSLSINLPFIKKVQPHVLISLSTLCLGIGLGAFAIFDLYSVSLATLFLIGALFSMVGISFSTLVMKHADPSNLGKVFGVIQTVLRGGQPLGVSLITTLLVVYNPQLIVTWIGVAVLLGGVYLSIGLKGKQQITISEHDLSK